MAFFSSGIVFCQQNSIIFLKQIFKAFSSFKGSLFSDKH